MTRADSPIQNVSDTAYMVAAYRALENERPDALFRDPFAARLSGEEGRQILHRLPKGLFFSGWTVVIRTRVIDRFVEEAIEAGIDTVLNLGAGLDARPYRMDLPSELYWIEADYPGILDLKERRLAGEKPRCRLERARVDLADPAARRTFLNGVVARSKKILVLTEGVTPYLEERDVAALADDLRAEPKIWGWIVDYFSPASYEYRRRSPIKKAMEKAPFRFEPTEYFQFFARRGWKPKEVRYLPEEADRLGRPFPMPLIMRLWMKVAFRFTPPERQQAFKQFSGFVLFEPAP